MKQDTLTFFSEITEEKRESEMRAARLSHAILQVIIEHSENHEISKNEIVSALLNTANYWQMKIIRDQLYSDRKSSEEEV